MPRRKLKPASPRAAAPARIPVGLHASRFACRYHYHARERLTAAQAAARAALEFERLEVALQGRVELTAGAQTFTLEAGEAYAIPAGLAHRRTALADETLVLSVTLERGDAHAAPSVVRAGEDGVCASLRAALVAVLPDAPQLNEAERAVVEPLLAALLARLSPASNEAPADEGATRALVARVKARIAERGGRPVTVADLAREAGYSTSHLSAAFRQIEGLPLKSYLDRFRAELAARHLVYGELTIGALAWELEFPDVYSFSRFFRRQMGCSPRAYRRRMRTPRSGVQAANRRRSMAGAR